MAQSRKTAFDREKCDMDWILFKVFALSYFIGWMVAIALKKL